MECSTRARISRTQDRAHAHIKIVTGATATIHISAGRRSLEIDFLRLDTTTITTVEKVANENEIAIFTDPEVTRIELADERRCRAKVEDRRSCLLQENLSRFGQGAAVDLPKKVDFQTPTDPNSRPFRNALTTAARPKQLMPPMNRLTETRQ